MGENRSESGTTYIFSSLLKSTYSFPAYFFKIAGI